MSVKEITSAANPIVKGIRALAMKKHREREGAFLAEGMKLATDALDSGWTVRTVMVSRNAEGERLARIEALAARVHAAGGSVLRCSDKVMQAVARRDNPQTVMAVIEERWLANVAPAEGETWLALDRCRDPGNLGTVIRTADALGAAGLVLVGPSTDPFEQGAVRATMGSLFHVPVARLEAGAFTDLAERFRTKGGQVVGTHLEGAVDHRAVDWRRTPTLIVMGNEAQGLDPALAPACDRLALIAMSPGRGADSLNLGVSTGIVLHEARRHLLAAPPKEVPGC